MFPGKPYLYATKNRYDENRKIRVRHDLSERRGCHARHRTGQSRARPCSRWVRRPYRFSFARQPLRAAGLGRWFLDLSGRTPARRRAVPRRFWHALRRTDRFDCAGQRDSARGTGRLPEPAPRRAGVRILAHRQHRPPHGDSPYAGRRVPAASPRGTIPRYGASFSRRNAPFETARIGAAVDPQVGAAGAQGADAGPQARLYPSCGRRGGMDRGAAEQHLPHAAFGLLPGQRFPRFLSSGALRPAGRLHRTAVFPTRLGADRRPAHHPHAFVGQPQTQTFLHARHVGEPGGALRGDPHVQRPGLCVERSGALSSLDLRTERGPSVVAQSRRRADGRFRSRRRGQRPGRCRDLPRRAGNAPDGDAERNPARRYGGPARTADEPPTTYPITERPSPFPGAIGVPRASPGPWSFCWGIPASRRRRSGSAGAVWRWIRGKSQPKRSGDGRACNLFCAAPADFAKFIYLYTL